MGHGNRGRMRSSAQKAGMSAYNNDNQYLLMEEIPVMQAFVDSSNNVIDTYYGGNPTASDVNLLLQTEDEIRAKLFAEYHNAYTNRLNPVPYAERQVDTNPFGPYNYPSDGNGYGYLGGYNASNSYPIYDSLARRNPNYTIPENKVVETDPPAASSSPFYTNDVHRQLVPKAGAKFDSGARKALKQYIKQNGLA